MEYRSTSLPIDPALSEAWSCWLILDPRIELKRISEHESTVTVGVTEARFSLNIEELKDILAPLRNCAAPSDLAYLNAERGYPGRGASVIERLVQLGFIVKSTHAPISDLYARAARMQIGGIADSENSRAMTLSPERIGLAEVSSETEKMVKRHRSCRVFNETAMTSGEVSDLLFAGYGVNPASDALSSRPVPSAGGLYSLQLAFRLREDDNIKIFHPEDHTYSRSKINWPSEAIERILGTPNLEHAGVLLFIFADLNFIACKYKEKAYRFACLDAGHLAQNVVRWAEHRGFRTLCIGSADDDLISTCFRPLEYLYGIAIGKESNSQ